MAKNKKKKQNQNMENKAGGAGTQGQQTTGKDENTKSQGYNAKEYK